ncbi:MAG: hypothetical protein ABDH28_05970 [Brevinematia bacterium]
MKRLALKILYFTLEYLGIIEVIFQIKSSNILVGIFLNYLFGKKPLKLVSGQLVDRNRMEFSIQRFIEKNVDIPIYVANLILPSEMFVNKVITIPAVARNKIESVVVSTIESIGIFDISSLRYSYKIVGHYRVKDRAFFKVLISAIKVSLLSEYVGYFRNLGISLVRITSATVSNVNIFLGISSVGAIAIAVNKQDEILISILSGNNILKFEITEISDRNVLENYIVSFISDFVKERSMFLEKVLLFYFEPDFVERVFDRVNIITISGEMLPEFSWLNENFFYLDIISSSRGWHFIINILPKKDFLTTVSEMVLFRTSFILTLLVILGVVFVASTRNEVERYNTIKKGIEEKITVASPEVERYIRVIEIKRKMEEYEKSISSFYNKFANKQRYFYTLYEIFTALDENTWLKSVEVLPKVIKVKGFSENSESFHNTIKKISKVQRISNIEILSLHEISYEGKKVLRFELGIGL